MPPLKSIYKNLKKWKCSSSCHVTLHSAGRPLFWTHSHLAHLRTAMSRIAKHDLPWSLVVVMQQLFNLTLCWLFKKHLRWRAAQGSTAASVLSSVILLAFTPHNTAHESRCSHRVSTTHHEQPYQNKILGQNFFIMKPFTGLSLDTFVNLPSNAVVRICRGMQIMNGLQVTPACFGKHKRISLHCYRQQTRMAELVPGLNKVNKWPSTLGISRVCGGP